MIRKVFFSLLFCISFGASAESQVLKVGVITTLTGKMSTIGTAVKNGIELARLDRPEAFSNVEFIYEDDQFDGKQSIAAFEKLKDIDHVSIIFGFGDTLGLVVGPLAERAGVPLINFNFDAGAAKGRKLVVRSLNHTQQYMRALAQYMQSKRNTKFYIVRSESAFFNAMADSFKMNVSEDGIVEEVGSVNPSENDFRSIIYKLLTREPGPVGLFLGPDQLISFAKQARELHLVRTFFGTDLFETASGIETEGKLFNGALYADNDVSNEFRSHYQERYENDSQLTFAGSAYDITNLISEIKLTPDFFSKIETIRSRDGVLGNFSFVNDVKFGKYFEYPIYIKQIYGTTGIRVE